MEDEPYLIQNTADLFWRFAQQSPTYPVPLEEIVGWAFPLWLHSVPRLSLHSVRDWLIASNLVCPFLGKDRRLRGCLFAYRDQGVIFLECDDPPDEQRFTLAHELAHFLLDYWLPRQRAIVVLGERIRDVLDGVRVPTVEERIHAVLASTPLGVHSHLMERPEQGLPASVVLHVETRADLLALEILAPVALLLASSHMCPSTPHALRLSRLTATLVNQYGLPLSIAAPYARRLLRAEGGPTIQDWLQGLSA